MCPEDRGQEFREQRESKVSRVRRYADRKGAAGPRSSSSYYYRWHGRLTGSSRHIPITAPPLPGEVKIGI